MSPMQEPGAFPGEGFTDEGGASGRKGIVGIVAVVVLVGLGYMAAARAGWLGGGDRSGIPFEGTPLDSAGASESGPAMRGPGTDTPTTWPDTGGRAAGPRTESEAPPESARPQDVPGESAAPAEVPPVAAEPAPRRTESVVEDGPLPLREFVLIRPGSFRMGYSDAAADQRPVHAVILSKEFYLQRSEVTQGQWRSVMGTDPSHFSGCDDCPVEQVSWHDVQAFLETLNARYPGREYRLPTEAEWEYAARADEGTGYEDVGALEEAAWFDANSGARTHPVESKLANPRGLYDMHGNVAEWVSDWYRADYYRTGPAVDPSGPGDGPAKVVRGGSWGSPRRFVGTLGRMDRDPFTRDWSIGFRLARDP